MAGPESFDPYATLDVDASADPAEIKAAYRKLAMRFHPDRNPGDAAAEAQFKHVSEAYALLSDPERRARFDRYGREGGTVMGWMQTFRPPRIFLTASSKICLVTNHQRLEWQGAEALRKKEKTFVLSCP